MRLTRSRIVVLLVLLVLASGAWTGARLLMAKSHLEKARTSLSQARTDLVNRDLDQAATDITAAGRETKQAHHLTGDPITFLWSHVPVVGRSVAVGRGLSSSADELARSVLPPALQVARGLDPAALRAPDGSINLPLLASLSGPVSTASNGAQSVQRKVSGLPHGFQPAVISRARSQFADQLATLVRTLRDADAGVRLAPTFLGKGTTRHWFVMLQQDGESRGTGGIIGGYAVLDATNGKLTVSSQGSNADLKSVTVPGTSVSSNFHDRYDLSGAFQIWPNVNISPDFPMVANLVKERWSKQGGGPLDGVIAVDAVALADLLKGSPGIDVGNGKTVSSDQLVDYLDVGQYVGQTDLQSRKDHASEVAAQVLGRLTTGSDSGTTKALLTGLVTALGSGHVHFASPVTALAPALARSGLDGALPTGSAPVAYAVVNNGAGDKLDSFLDRSISYTGGSCSGSRRSTTITVTLVNRAPAVGTLPPYVTIRPDISLDTHSSTGRVQLGVFGTRGAALVSATLDGKAISTVQGRTTVHLDSSTEAGLPVWEVNSETLPNQPVVLVLHLSEPVTKGAPRVPEQPLIRPLKRTVDLPTCR